MLRADEGSETHDARRLAAIDAYNLYLASSPDAEDRETVVGLLPGLVDAVATWIDDGAEEAARRFNR